MAEELKINQGGGLDFAPTNLNQLNFNSITAALYKHWSDRGSNIDHRAADSLGAKAPTDKL